MAIVACLINDNIGKFCCFRINNLMITRYNFVLYPPAQCPMCPYIALQLPRHWRLFFQKL